MKKEGTLDKKIRGVVNGGKRENKKIRGHGKQATRKFRNEMSIPWLLEVKKEMLRVLILGLSGEHEGGELVASTKVRARGMIGRRRNRTLHPGTSATGGEWGLGSQEGKKMPDSMSLTPLV